MGQTTCGPGTRSQKSRNVFFCFFFNNVANCSPVSTGRTARNFDGFLTSISKKHLRLIGRGKKTGEQK